MGITHLLPLLPAKFWPRVVISVRILSRGQIDLFKNLFVFYRTVYPPPKKNSWETTKNVNIYVLLMRFWLAHWLSGRVFANSPGDRGSISGWIIPKIQKVVLDTSLLNTQHYKICFKVEVEQSRERSSTLPYTLV